MSVGEALGKSCNPVFGQLGTRYLNGFVLAKYARLFGFNRSLALEAPLTNSAASIPTNDLYELSRTSAGFGEVRISPIHAAAIMSGIANGGLLPRPQLVEKIVSPDGAVLHRPQAEMLQRIVRPSTASTLLQMMEYTTTVGTSRREFQAASSRPALGDLRVAAKTGTLRGTNPVGLNNWFIAAAPIDNPELAIAVITVDPGASSKASHLGRRVFEQYFNITPAEPERVTARATVRSTTRSKTSRTRTTKKPTYPSISPKKKSKAAVVARAPKKKSNAR
jgi:cell division protein FtsI/penicillin-binding protein 2